MEQTTHRESTHQAESPASKRREQEPGLRPLDHAADSETRLSALSAEEALARLRSGNERYLQARTAAGDVSPQARLATFRNGQEPYAIVLACSDSRVIPEAIFSAGIGELFTIRVAGNVVDNHQLGSIEYAEEHLGCRLVVVLGHTCCGAVDAALHHEPYGAVRFITDEIAAAIGDEHDEARACLLNVARSVHRIEESRQMRRDEAEAGLRVVGALYHTDSGAVEFFDDIEPLELHMAERDAFGDENRAADAHAVHAMRRPSLEMHDAGELRATIDACPVLRIGSNDAEGPFVVPVSFGYDWRYGENADDSAAGDANAATPSCANRGPARLTLWIHGATIGRKADAFAANPLVAVEMDVQNAIVGDGKTACSYTAKYRSIMGVGRIAVEADPARIRHGLTRIMEHTAPGAPSDRFADSAIGHMNLYRIDVERFTGKRRS